tara:strand:+ start:3943 stop:4803 length:861 start_codon:yes stop_codon:yes gene_type:complete
VQTRGFKYFVLLFSVGCVFTTCLDGLIPNDLYTGQNSDYPECIPELFVFNASTSLGSYFFNVVLLGGLEIEPDDWVGAFNGNVCVGAKKWDTSQCGNNVCEVLVLGDEGSPLTDGYMSIGDIPTFKIFHASTQNYYPAYASTNEPWSSLSAFVIPILESCANSHDWDADGICDNIDNCIGVEDNLGNCLSVEKPLQFSLEQNYPNPFNPYTIIKFNLEKSNFIDLNIFDLAGNRVKNLVKDMLVKGSYEISWDGLDENSRKVPSSTYILSLQSGGSILSKKMTIIK